MSEPQFVDFKSIASRASSVKVNGVWTDLRWPTREWRQRIDDAQRELRGGDPVAAAEAENELPEDPLEAMERQIESGEVAETPENEEAPEVDQQEQRASNLRWWDTLCSLALAATVVTDQEMTVEEWSGIISAAESKAVEGLQELTIEAMRICGFAAASNLPHIPAGEPGSLIRNYVAEALEDMGPTPSI